jgi:hypothetical protein
MTHGSPQLGQKAELPLAVDPQPGHLFHSLIRVFL